jgi:cytochrome b561
MPVDAEPGRYDRVARTLHWLIAVLIVAVAAGAIVAGEMPRGPARTLVLDLHRAAGVATLALVMARVAWRLAHRPPPLPSATGRAIVLASRASHATLYVLMAAVPSAGLFYWFSRGRSVKFWLFDLPSPVASQGWADNIQMVHKALAWLLLSCAAIHAAAALWHYAVRRDGVMERMLPSSTGKDIGSARRLGA